MMEDERRWEETPSDDAHDHHAPEPGFSHESSLAEAKEAKQRAGLHEKASKLKAKAAKLNARATSLRANAEKLEQKAHGLELKAAEYEARAE